MDPESPKVEKGKDEQKPEINPTQKKPDFVATDANWGIPESNQLPYEVQPSPGSGDVQKSGAV